MIVVSDTTALSSLYLINELDWLGVIFGRVIIPHAVYQELLELEAAGYNLQVFHEASWLEIQTVQNTDLVNELCQFLDEGESEAIALAVEIEADYLLIDERKGSQKAVELGVSTIGLLRVILELKEKGVIPLVKPVLDDLRGTGGFWVGQRLYDHILEVAGES
jgi:predicted nucleic acid-binding protein